MSEAILDPGFPVSYCARCARDVLTHAHLDARGEMERSCLHCDGSMDPAEMRWVSEEELAVLGYSEVQTGGCGRPNCGQGRCGT